MKITLQTHGKSLTKSTFGLDGKPIRIKITVFDRPARD